jgi:hypothetical protein
MSTRASITLSGCHGPSKGLFTRKSVDEQGNSIHLASTKLQFDSHSKYKEAVQVNVSIQLDPHLLYSNRTNNTTIHTIIPSAYLSNMYILTLLTLLLTTALAVPNPYYGPEPSETLLPLSTILSPIAFPSSIASRSSNSSTTRPSTTTVEPIAFSSSVWSSGFLFLPSPSAWSLVSSTRSIRVSSTRATSVVVPTPTATAPVVPRQKVGVRPIFSHIRSDPTLHVPDENSMFEDMGMLMMY